jgi:bifunctional DNase/RNase
MIITCQRMIDLTIIFAMAKLEQVEPIALMPTQGGCAVFLGNGKKVIYFFIDPSIGASINGVLAQQAPERPLTHDLFMMTLESFGAQVLRVIIVAMTDEVYFARVIFQVENELQERKIVELDARPSDCIALAVRAHCPIYVVAELWEQLPDVSNTLEEMRKAADESE